MFRTFLANGLATGLALLGLPVLVAPVDAQSLYALDASGSLVVEFTGPRQGLWNSPNERIVSFWPTVNAFPCALPVAFGAPPALPGDVAVDVRRDTVWVTDGGTIAEYDRDGNALRAFGQNVFGGLVTGMGIDSTLGELWITDGTQAARIQPPPEACGGVPSVTLGPLALLSTVPPNPVTDLEWDPATSTLWICDTFGNVGNMNVDGTLGPAGAFVAPGRCDLDAPLTGLALDTSRTPTRVWVTDGEDLACFEPNGTLAEPTFVLTRACQNGTGAMLGLAFALRAVRYGEGWSPNGVVPEIDGAGQVWLGSPDFSVVVRGAVPGSIAVLYQSPVATCPLGLTGYFVLPRTGCPFSSLDFRFVDPTGFAGIPQPVPPTFPPGETTTYFWRVFTPSLEVIVTERLFVTLGRG